MFPQCFFSHIPLNKSNMHHNPPTEQPHRKVNHSTQNVRWALETKKLARETPG